MLNLSKKASLHFKCDFATLEKRDGDFWRMDVFRIDRLKYLICTHESTLYSIILRAKDYHSFASIENHIHENCKWYDQPFSLGRTKSLSLLGSIKQMLLILKHHGPDYSTVEMMEFVNNIPFRFTDFHSPKEALEKYKNR